MTREQAKREIDFLDYYLQNHTDDYGEESHTAMMMAIQALEQTQWIPVSERLPEEGGRYLVYTWSHEIETAQYVDGYWNIKTPISAWMPLPESYKGE